MDRRKFIKGTGSLILAGPVVAGASNPLNMACRGTHRLTPGPYRIESPQRSDITEGVPGIPLRLELQVIDDMFCNPVPGAVVDIWQCDANGLYSGVPNVVFDRNTLRITDGAVDMRGKTFLRGHELTDADGKVAFQTIFPGGYFPRLPHIHVRVQLAGVDWATLDTQLFFSDEVQARVFATEPYAAHAAGVVDLDHDLVLKGDQRARDELTVTTKDNGDGLVGHYRIATVAL